MLVVVVAAASSTHSWFASGTILFEVFSSNIGLLVDDATEAVASKWLTTRFDRLCSVLIPLPSRGMTIPASKTYAMCDNSMAPASAGEEDRQKCALWGVDSDRRPALAVASTASPSLLLAAVMRLCKPNDVPDLVGWIGWAKPRPCSRKYNCPPGSARTQMKHLGLFIRFSEAILIELN